MTSHELDEARRWYAEEVRVVANLKSPTLVRALAAVPRERFLGPGPWMLIGNTGQYESHDDDPKTLYHNVLVAIDHERGLNNGMPSFLCYLIDSLEIEPGDRILHVGCGTGYYSAIMAEVAGSSGRVTALEVDKALAERAAGNLADWRTVEVVQADGTTYEPGLVDVILVNAGATHPLPSWLDALAVGGRMILPLTHGKEKTMDLNGGVGRILLIRREPKGYAARFIGMVGIFHCDGARSAKLDRRLKAAFKSKNPDAVRSLRRDPKARDDTCWLFGDDFWLSTRALEDD